MLLCSNINIACDLNLSVQFLLSGLYQSPLQRHNLLPLLLVGNHGAGTAGHVVARGTADRPEGLVPQELRQAHLGHHAGPSPGRPVARPPTQQEHQARPTPFHT